MLTEDYNYNLPEKLIAQTPLKERSSSKLLVLDKSSHTKEDKYFKDIIDYLEEGDTLVINDTKVIPARLYGMKEETNAVVQILMLKNIGEELFQQD